MNVVYFVQAGAGGPIKIGTAGDIRSRLAALQNASAELLTVLATIEGDRRIEARFHAHLRSHRIRGEWFKPSPAVLDAIERAKTGEIPSESEKTTVSHRSPPSNIIAFAAHPILTEIDAFCATHQMAESTFGREALGDWKFVKELRGDNRDKPRRLWPETEQKVRHFMATYRPDARQDAAA